MKTIIVGKIDPSIKEVLEKLNNLKLDFCVTGGLLCQYYLKDHARYTKDVDILFSSDLKVVEEELRRLFGTIDFYDSEGTDSFYEPYFTCFSKVNGLKGQIEGKKIDFLNEIRTEQYSYEGITFKGVCVEFNIAEKLVSLLNELSRPYKHLVDIYSLIKSDLTGLDKNEIRRYMSLINEQENRFRKSKGIKEYELPKRILESKEFTPPFMVPTLQSKHNVSKSVMVSEINEWLKQVL